MIYFIGEEKELFTPETIIGYGEEGKVFYKKDTNEAVKIFYTFNSLFSEMSLAEAIEMSQIKTSHILLPQRMIYDERGVFEGYTTPFIRKDKDLKEDELPYYPVEKLMEIFSVLYQDIYAISDKRLIINDIQDNKENHMFNGMFYLIDPGYYYFSNKSSEDVLKDNIKRINKFLCHYALGFNEKKILAELKRRGLTYTLCDYLKDEAKPQETFMNLVRRKK